MSEELLPLPASLAYVEVWAANGTEHSASLQSANQPYYSSDQMREYALANLKAEATAGVKELREQREQWKQLVADQSDRIASLEQQLAEAREEIEVTDKLLEARNRVISLIPACEAHGDQCLPHAKEWIEQQLAPDQQAKDAARPIDTAPEGELVVVLWLDPEDGEHPERYAFDYLEDGLWMNYFNEHEHYAIAGVARGNSEGAPYTHWWPLPVIDAALSTTTKQEEV